MCVCSGHSEGSKRPNMGDCTGGKCPRITFWAVQPQIRLCFDCDAKHARLRPKRAPMAPKVGLYEGLGGSKQVENGPNEVPLTCAKGRGSFLGPKSVTKHHGRALGFPRRGPGPFGAVFGPFGPILVPRGYPPPSVSRAQTSASAMFRAQHRDLRRPLVG